MTSPSPRSEDDVHMPRSTKKVPKQSRSIINRSSKKSSSAVQAPSVTTIDKSRRRVWKACDRCRMKKTKCDGESPCRRCKDDGMVCSASARRQSEFKQISRGYAEVLENTQHALLATTHKLYAMVRNNEPWILGEPELNSRGQPVVHDIATRLGCIRPSTDLSDALVEDLKSYTQFQTKFETRCVEMGTGYSGNRRASASSLSPACTERASSADSGCSLVYENCKQTLWVQEQQEQPPIDVKVNCSVSSQTTGQGTPSTGRRDPEYESSYGSSLSEEDHFNSNTSATFPYPSPFTPLSTDSDFLGQDGPIDLTSQFIWALQCETQIN